MTKNNCSTNLPTIQSKGVVNVARFHVNLTGKISRFVYSGSLIRPVNIFATLMLVITLVAGVPNVKAAPVIDRLQQQSSIRAAFYYPWFPEAWTQKGTFPYTNYHPSLGYYDSSDQTILKKQIQAMQYGNIQVGIASWWGQGSKTDGRVPALLQAASGGSFKWTLYYEQESLGDPSVSQLTNDLTYIRDHYASDPGFLNIDGRFVVFVYADAVDGCGMADRWKQANTVNAYIVLKVFPGYASCASQPEGWHQYSPAVATDAQGSYSYSISPGFWLYGNSERLGRDLTRWNTNIRSMIASGALFQLVTTFNEWGEGTVVEPATEWSSASGYGEYLDALHNNGQVVSSPTVALTATSTPNTPVPTATNASVPTATSTPNTPVPTATNTTVPTVVNTLVATPTSTSVGSTTTTFSPSADAYVNSSAVNTNYGGSKQLRFDNSPVVRDYLRFNVQGLSGTVTKASLRIYANSASAAGYQVYMVPDTSWGEMSINYTNAPTLGGLAGSFGPFSAGAWTTVDITSFITGNGTVSLSMTGLNSTAVSLVSREGGANAPQLVITTGGGSVATQTVAPTATSTPNTPVPTATNTSVPTATSIPNTPVPTATNITVPTATSTPNTPVPTATNTSVPTAVNTLVATPTSTSVGSTTTTFTSAADSYVDSSAVNTNYGGSTQLRFDNSPVVRDYLRFNVQGLSGTVTKASLRIYANSASTAGYQVYIVPDTSWGEMSINYTNAPTLGGLAGSFGPFSAGAWTTVDITSFITGNGTVSLSMTGLNSTAVSLVSREGGANAPQLVITTGGGSVATQTAAPSATPTATAISIATATATKTNTPIPTQVFTATPTATAISIATATPTKTNTPLPTQVFTAIPTATAISIATATPTKTNTPMPTQVFTATPPATAVSTATAVPTFTSTPVSGGDPVLVGAGDISSCSNTGDEATAKLIDNISGTVFTAGDDAYESGTTTEFNNCYDPTWGRFKARTHPAPGNHEYNTSGASGYYTYFGSAAGDPTKGYYSYNLGTWHIVSLNSEISEGAGSAQEQWLRQDLAANPSLCTLAIWHEPLFSSGSSHGSTPGSKALWQALYDYHAEVVVNGHEHNYERFAPQSSSGVADPNGIREFVAGMGGRSHYGFGTILPNSVVRNNDTYGVIKFTLHSGSYDWQFVPEAGKTFADSGTAQCNP